MALSNILLFNPAVTKHHTVVRSPFPLRSQWDGGEIHEKQTNSKVKSRVEINVFTKIEKRKRIVIHKYKYLHSLIYKK